MILVCKEDRTQNYDISWGQVSLRLKP